MAEDFELDSVTEMSFQIIMSAGDAKGNAIGAMRAANEYKFEEAEKLLSDAKKSMQEAHHAQTDLMKGEANGSHVDVNIILVHSQDHLSMAFTAIDLAEEALTINRKLQKLEQMLGGKE